MRGNITYRLFSLTLLWPAAIASSACPQSEEASFRPTAVCNTIMQLDRGSFVVDYAPSLGIPQSVTYTVSPSDLGIIKREPSFKFKTDKETPKPRVSSSMYANTGFQRGHMCPAASRSATRALMRSTFIMTNVCPMTKHINTGRWKMTENKERAVARQTGMCNVIAAPLFYPCDTLRISKGRICVPHAFMKIIYTTKPPRVYGWYIIENVH